MEWLRKLLGRGVKAEAPTDTHPPLPDIDPATAPSQGFAKPHFRFFPEAYAFGEDGEEIFKRQEGPCHCCGMRDIYAYQGSIYWARRDDPMICAQCIADGKLGTLLGAGDHYALHDCEFDTRYCDGPEFEEVCLRTPGFATYNPFTWPTSGTRPMAFVGYGDDKRWRDHKPARAAMAEAWKVVERVADDLGSDTGEGLEAEDFYPSPYLLMFRRVDGEFYSAIIDPC